MSGSWDCPHEVDEQCQKVRNRPCDPGMKGCVLAGRFIFSNKAKNPSGRNESSRTKTDPRIPRKTK